MFPGNNMSSETNFYLDYVKSKESKYFQFNFEINIFLKDL